MADVIKNQGNAKPARKTRVAANVLANPTPARADVSEAPVMPTQPVSVAAVALEPAAVEAKPVAPVQAQASPTVVEPVSAGPAIEAKPIETNQTADTTTNTTVQTGAKTMTDTINNTMNSAATTAQNAAQQTAEQLRGAMNQAGERGKAVMERGQRVAEEMADISRGNMEAVVASSKTAAKYVETLAQGAADYSRRSFEEASAAMRSFAEVKSPADFFRLQSEFARTAFDAAIAETARVSETVVKMGGEIAEPITSRYAVAAERLKTTVAA